MSVVERLPWFEEYSRIVDSITDYEKEIKELENPEQQLTKIKKFYNSLGADYSKNEWIVQAEKDISFSNHADDSRLVQLKKEVKFGTVLYSAVHKQDDDSISDLNQYRNDDFYGNLINKIMFYIGVSKSKTESEYVKKAYDGIYRMYPVDKISITKFNLEGAPYYIYYFQCLQILLNNTKESNEYMSIVSQIRDICFNAKLMFNRLISDPYMGVGTKDIISEIENVLAIIDNNSEDNY